MAFTAPESEQLLILGQELIRRVYADDDPAAIRAWLRGRVEAAAPTVVDATLLWKDSFDFYDEVLKLRAERSMLPPEKRREFILPYKSWRAMIDDPDGGQLFLLAAPPGTGKTIVAEMTGEANAKAGADGLFFHAELSKAVMMDRRAVRGVYGHVDRRTFKRGLLTEEQIARLSEDVAQHPEGSDGLDWVTLSRTARQLLNEANARMKAWSGSVDYVHSPGWTVDQYVEHIRGEYERRKDTDRALNFVIIDYLGKIVPSVRQQKMFGTNVYARDADTVEQLKSLAEQLNIPIFILDQLNKAGRSADLADLDGTQIRGAGEKTEKINLGIILDLERDENTGEPTENLRAKIFKNTMGVEGVIMMKRHAAAFTILDVQQVSLEWGT